MPSDTLEPGSRLGKYELLAHLATGGMGTVYKARDCELGRVVALKVLSPEISDDVLMERFRREARHAARLNHPNIVTLFECNYDPELGLHYLALEFINGIDLAQYIEQRGKLPPEEVRRILMQAAKALQHAFEHGVVHRDIKPANLMLARTARKTITLKLTDLGLAIARGEQEFRVTREGSTVGTVDYMAPEQARDSRAVDIRSDIYSLGCTAYHMLAGRAPFAEGGLGERLVKHLETPPTDVRKFNPGVSPAFWVVIETMLAKRPEDRYATPSELLRALKRIRADEDGADASERAAPAHLSPAEPTRLSVPAIRPDTRHPAAAPRIEPLETDATHVAGPAVSPEQARAAAAFHQRAVQVLAEGGGADYSRQLIDNCIKLDPLNLTYRKTLRELNRKATSGVLGRWFGSLNVLAGKSKVKLARAAGDWRKVLELGEQILAQQPGDVDTHIDLAEVALDLGLSELARWFLEEGCHAAPDSAQLLRALARLHEHLEEWKPAIRLWRQLSKADPTDVDAARKVNDLSALALISKSRARRQQDASEPER
ncbi:MAG: protein kinase [Planctomycetes bacterium]|nr:protein kinase [Planctomycetota bacterium]